LIHLISMPATDISGNSAWNTDPAPSMGGWAVEKP
jgi:hypothetical protein